MRKKFPNVQEDGLQLLSKMLQFNPFFRPTVEECLKSSYFEKVSQFSEIKEAGKIINFVFESNDYVSLVEIRRLMIAEINYYSNLKTKGISDLSP